MRVPRILALAVVLALAGAGLAGTAPSVSITSPADGGTVGASFSASGSAAFDVPQREPRTFYLRLVTTCDELLLSVERGPERGSCGYLEAYTPLNEVTRRGYTYRAVDGLPLTLDATQPITGVLTMYGLANAGTGRGTVEITLAGETGGEQAQIGTASADYLAVPFSDPVVPWSIVPPASLDRRDLTKLEATVIARGAAQVGMAYTRSNDSNLTVPAWSASFDRRVEVSLDDGDFGTAIPATLSEDLGTWWAPIEGAAPGPHRIYARAVQGGIAGEPVSVAVTAT